MSEEIRPGFVRVSEIVDLFDDYKVKDDGNIWINGKPINPEVIENKKRIGKEVHELIEMYLRGVDWPVPEDCKGYFDSFLEWHSHFGEKFSHLENRFYSENLKISGQIDGIWAGTLMDWKTSASPNPKSWKVQGGLYSLLCMENNIDIEMCTFVNLKKNGKKPSNVCFVVDKEMKFLAMSYYTVFKHRYPERFA